MSISDDRRKERRVRWLIFLFVTCTWIYASWGSSTGITTLGIIAAVLIFLKTWNTSRIPVLAYHSISDHPEWLGRADLSVSTNTLDSNMRWLARNHYSCISLDEFTSRTSLATINKPILVTFDDGYLDNWVAAEPVLRKHGVRGTVYVSSNWIEQGDECRSQLNAASNASQWKGYLNPAEIHALAQGGVLDIQSHAASHDRLFCSDKITGFVTADDTPRWLQVLRQTEKCNWYKPGNELPIGYPIFASGEALAVPQYYPSPALISTLTEIASNTDPAANTHWQEKLNNAVASFQSTHNALGRMETSVETKARWRKELEESKQTLETFTGKPVRHLCWPRDAYCAESRQLAFDVGYKTITAGASSNQGADNRQLSRIYIEDCGVPFIDQAVFISQIWLFRGHIWIWPLVALGNRLIRLLQRAKR